MASVRRPPSRTGNGPPPPTTRRIVSTSRLNQSTQQTTTTNPPLLLPRDRTTSTTTIKTRKEPLKGDGNIKVVVRCRGVSPTEIRNRLQVVAEVPSSRGTKVTLTDPSPSLPSSSTSTLSNSTSSSTPSTSSTSTSTVGNNHTRSWDFGDRQLEGHSEPKGNVYGPDAKQAMVYDEVAKPILEQVLEGYNCTIFAYGQTGTGKTYTMEGDLSPNGATFHDDAGIIPRTLYYLFDHLSNKSEACEYTVRCSFVELYNEELRDLNARDPNMPTTNESTTTMTGEGGGGEGDVGISSRGVGGGGGLRIYDETKNGSTGVVIQGVEETFITDAEEGLEVLRRGSERRQIASTNMNERSSRSHSIFSIQVHLKDTSAKEGTDLLKVGKLNLVDLAGSENVGRSGAVHSRAREAGKINASLLALGRVITMLSENNNHYPGGSSSSNSNSKKQHIPYRESKLTRLLQDSLGGNTKTTIIATISPTSYEETASTLTYALQATSIQNRPEANQRVSKDVVLNQVMMEMVRLKNDLKAARGVAGYFVSKESLEEFESERRQFKSDRVGFEKSKAELEISRSELQSTRDQLEQNVRALSKTKESLKRCTDELKETKDDLIATTMQLEETRVENAQLKVLTDAYEKSREGWKDEAHQALDDLDGLRAKIARKTEVEQANLAMLADASSSIASRTTEITQQTHKLRQAQGDFVWTIEAKLGEFSKRQRLHVEQTKQVVELQMNDFAVNSFKLAEVVQESSRGSERYRSLVEDTCASLYRRIDERAMSIEAEQASLAEQLRAELVRHSTQTNMLLESLIEPVQAMQVDCLDRLEQDRLALASMAQRDLEALQAENAFLRQVVENLEIASIDEQHRLAEEEAAIIARVQAEVSAASRRRQESTKAMFETVRERVEVRRGETDEMARTRRDQMELLGSNNVYVGDRVHKAVEGCQIAKEEGTKHFTDSVMTIDRMATLQATSAAKARQEQLDLLRNAAAFINDSSSLAHAETERSRLEARKALLALVDQSGETFAAWSLSTEGAHRDVEETTATTVHTVDDYANIAARAISSITICNDGLASTLQADLQRRVRHDLSTGSTPKPKPRPVDRLLPVVDLDSCDRPTVLETLLRVQSADIAASLAADEERGAELAEIRGGGSSTMARSPSLESVPPVAAVPRTARSSSVAVSANKGELRRSKVHVLGERDSNVVPTRRVVAGKQRILKKSVV